MIDPINGTTATVDRPGQGGESGSVYNSQWAATAGEMWQGGAGCEFGGGGTLTCLSNFARFGDKCGGTGGGGYFGGGGGGTMPGISGGGGGGASYVFVPMVVDYVCVSGHGVQPGGLTHRPSPPLACGLVGI